MYRSDLVLRQDKATEQAWLGKLSWQESRPGSSFLVARSCMPQVRLTTQRQWTFELMRPCTVFI